MDLELDGATLIVTGGTDGLGLALAQRLLREGARVAICGRDGCRLAQAEAALSPLGPVMALSADVTVRDDVDGLVDRVVAEWGGLDGIVNNAGVHAGGPFATSDDAAWQADIDLKVMAIVRLTRRALPHLSRAPRAAVVNVLSVTAKAPGALTLPTSATRAAGLAITKALSVELAPQIRVNAILVGKVQSGQWRRYGERAGGSPEAVYAQLAQTIPLGRVGRAEEFADVAAFLLSPRASFVTGCGINVDGGESPAV